jgi:hypothetical protein
MWDAGGRYGSRGWCPNRECSLHRRPSHRHFRCVAPARCDAFGVERRVVAGDEGGHVYQSLRPPDRVVRRGCSGVGCWWAASGEWMAPRHTGAPISTFRCVFARALRRVRRLAARRGGRRRRPAVDPLAVMLVSSIMEPNAGVAPDSRKSQLRAGTRPSLCLSHTVPGCDSCSTSARRWRRVVFCHRREP